MPTVEAVPGRALLRAADRWRFAACIWYSVRDGWAGSVIWSRDVSEREGKTLVVDFCERAGMAPQTGTVE
jgi:hypothetical protein